MDNRIISIQSEGREDFDLAFQLIFGGRKATHYAELPKNGLVFFWHEDTGLKTIKLPIPLKWKEAADLAWAWLQEQPNSSYKEFLDHDGDNGRGFRVYNEDWTHVAESFYGICGVIPIWAWYGK